MVYHDVRRTDGNAVMVAAHCTLDGEAPTGPRRSAARAETVTSTGSRKSRLRLEETANLGVEAVRVLEVTLVAQSRKHDELRVGDPAEQVVGHAH
jgi:hypothetical protein